MLSALAPGSLRVPFGRYSHGVLAPASAQLLLTSGQLGIHADGTIPPSVEDQAALCFESIRAILAEAGAGRENILRLNAYVTDRAHMGAYMAARDAFLDGLDPRPASTLMIVSGFTLPEFLVEVEATAAIPA